MITQKLLRQLTITLACIFGTATMQAQCNASFTASINGSAVTFTNTSTGGFNPLYYWDFGDGNYSSNFLATHAYNSNGCFRVCLTMTDSVNNCTSVFCDSVCVGNSSNCNIADNDSVTNASTCNACDGSISLSPTGGTAPYSFLWSNGATTQTVSNLCTGNYNVVITDATNCSVTYWYTVSCQNTSTCLASFTATVNGNTVTFTNTSSNANSFFANFTWTFGDNTMATGASPAPHTYASNGVYIVCLTVNDSLNNCFSTFCDSVVIGNTCPLYILDSTANASNCNTCDGMSTVVAWGGTAPYTYVWSNNATGSTVSGLCPGTYTVVVTDANGCTSSRVVTVSCGNTVLCSASFYIGRDSLNSLIGYLYPTITGTGPFTYFWDFGDGNTSTLPSPSHTYATPGSYVICLTMTDANNCTSMWCDSSSFFRMSTPNYLQYINVVNGVNEQDKLISKVYPNPASDQISVQLNSNADGVVRISDMLGKTVLTQNINGNQLLIDTHQLPEGCYNLTVQTDRQTMNERIVIIRK